MTIEKALYEAPMGMEQPVEDGSMEFEVQPPVELEDGSVEITLGASEEETTVEELKDFGTNLAEHLPENEVTKLATDLFELVGADIQSRKEWTDTYVQGLDVLGLKYEERTEPWDGACGVYSSLLSEAAIRFQADTIMETFPAAGPVKTKIIGVADRAKEQAAERVRTDMNYQLTERMSEYRPEHERMLYNLSLAGSAFKKIYFDPMLARQVAMFIPAEDIVVPYGSSNIETAQRVTHVLRKTQNELKKMQVDGFYIDEDLGDPAMSQTDVEEAKADLNGESYNATTDDRYQLYEVHLYHDFESDPFRDPNGVALPYVVTLETGTTKILSIRRNWLQEDTTHQRVQHFVHYAYIPGFGFYGMGLIHIIGGYARAGTSIIRQLVDAGTLSNLPGGLKARGMRIKGDDTPISPGEFRDVDVPSGKIQDNVMTLPYKEPSLVLFNLLKEITEEGRRLGAISDMDISDMSAQMPVGTTLALLERTLKPMSAVQARVHFTMKQEFKLLAAIMREHAPTEYDYDPETGNRAAKREDFALVEVIPVSDPNSATMAQRVVQYQAALELASTAPQIYDLPQLHRQMLEVIGIKNANKLVPVDEDQLPRDPVSENMSLLTGKPAKAFIYQNHDAHIAVHMTFMQDPMMAQMMGQTPMAQQMQAATMAHISEHLAFQYRRQIEERMGVPLPPPDEQLPEDIEVQLSALVAQAGQQLLQMHTMQAQQAQAQQQAQDPLIQIEMAKLENDKKELQIKAADLARKVKKDKDDADLKEMTIAVNAQRTGVMGRTQELQIQQRDRDTADRNRLELIKIANTNKAGSSGDKEKPDGQ
jgi:hypothetical protein